jgi:hypothetical protein
VLHAKLRPFGFLLRIDETSRNIVIALGNLSKRRKLLPGCVFVLALGGAIEGDITAANELGFNC